MGRAAEACAWSTGALERSWSARRLLGCSTAYWKNHHDSDCLSAGCESRATTGGAKQAGKACLPCAPVAACRENRLKRSDSSCSLALVPGSGISAFDAHPDHYHDVGAAHAACPCLPILVAFLFYIRYVRSKLLLVIFFRCPSRLPSLTV